MMMWVWPSGWRWTPRQPEYEQMILDVYATLGVFLIRAEKGYQIQSMQLLNTSILLLVLCDFSSHGFRISRYLLCLGLPCVL
jgi:hypothetical protein